MCNVLKHPVHFLFVPILMLSLPVAGQWNENGNPVNANSGDQSIPVIVSDRLDGAVISWYNSYERSVYAQRVDWNGSLVWSPDGVLVSEGNTYLFEVIKP